MSSVFYIFKDFNFFSLLHFQRLQCLLSFMLSKTTMSLVFYAFKYYNVFSLFTLSKTSMSFVFYALKDYNVFCFMISRLQCLLLYDFKYNNFLFLSRLISIPNILLAAPKSFISNSLLNSRLEHL